MSSIFTDSENELLFAAKLVLSDGLRRLNERQSLFPTSRGRAVSAECREARDALASTLVATYGALRHEVSAVALIDAQGRLINIEEMPQGHAAHCEIRPRLLAEMITRTGAVAVLIVHNHPSGSCSPSRADIEVTTMLEGWLKVMDCALIDHLVLTVDDWCNIKGEW